MSKINNKIPILTAETAISILTKILEELETPEVSRKLEEARDNVGNEMLKIMQYVFPVVLQVEMDVIKEYDFPEGKEGLMKFSQMIRTLEREDAEVARLHGIIKSTYLPPINSGNEHLDERVSSN